MQASVSNVDKVFAQLKAEIEANLEAQFEAETQRIFKHLVEVTPQWSGDLAANWRISLTPTEGAYQSPFKQPEWQNGPWAHMGDPAAVAYALASSQNVEISYKNPVYFTNGTPLIFSTTLVAGDGTSSVVRPENLIDGKVAMVSYILSTYKAGVAS